MKLLWQATMSGDPIWLKLPNGSPDINRFKRLAHAGEQVWDADQELKPPSPEKKPPSARSRLGDIAQ